MLKCPCPPCINDRTARGLATVAMGTLPIIQPWAFPLRSLRPSIALVPLTMSTLSSHCHARFIEQRASDTPILPPLLSPYLGLSPPQPAGPCILQRSSLSPLGPGR